MLLSKAAMRRLPVLCGHREGRVHVDTSGDGRGGRLLSVAMIVIFDIAGPLLAYNGLRSAGLSTVAALLLSGAFPALGVIIGVAWSRRVDAIGALVLAGIVVGTVLGLVTHDARLVLMEGSVPTAVFGLVCLGSLWARHPLLFTVVREFTGPDTAKGRAMTGLWRQEPLFRRDFRVITGVWGCAFLLEAAARAVIVESASTGTALSISKVMPFVVAGVVSAWTVAYGTYRKRRSIALAIAAGQTAGPGGVNAASAAGESSELDDVTAE
jgi:hypothetical protein